MVAPAIIPILKKVASVIVSDKKLRKIAVGIVLGALFLVCLPIIAILGMFSGVVDAGMNNVNALLAEKQQIAEVTASGIEKELLANGYSPQRIEEAQALYVSALFGYSEDEGFIEKFIGCFAPEQTDEELIVAVNNMFGTTVTVDEYTDVVQEIREKYAKQEENETQ